MISSKTEPHNGSKKKNWNYGEVRNNKSMLKTLSLIWILYLKQQSNILRSFYSWRFEKSLFSSKFSVSHLAGANEIFCSKSDR